MPATSSSQRKSLRRRPKWQLSIQRAIRDPRELRRLLELPPTGPGDELAQKSFPVFVPLEYARRIRPGDASDPLLRQVLPDAAELHGPVDAATDAVGDAAAQRQPGLLKKYANRVLFMPTMNCAVHCRYCFRRNYLTPDFFHTAAWRNTDESQPERHDLQDDLPDRWLHACRAIATDTEVDEVILSGGDPLMLRDGAILGLVDRLGHIDHLNVLRIHTRLPVMIPSRITKALTRILGRSSLHVICVVHVNHPREVDECVVKSLQRLRQAGVVVLNQSVLLRGVNDSVDTLAELSRVLIRAGVLPYYLHQLDRAAGVTHFEVPIEDGRRMIEQLRRRLPGYAVPRYVQEVAGEPYKIPLA